MKIAKFVLLSGLLSLSVNAEVIEIEHALGTTKVKTNPERVITFGLGALDATEALGIQPIAISLSSTFPDYLSQYQEGDYVSVGTTKEPNFETVYMQKPDLIIIGPRSVPQYEELSKIAPTIVFAPDDQKGYWKSTKQQWRNLGEIFEKQRLVENKISKLEQSFKQIHDYNQQHKTDALTVMIAGGNITAFGAGSRFSTIYNEFGFEQSVKSIKVSNHGDLISYEFIKKADPSTLIVIDKDKLINKGKSETKRQFENDLVKQTKAYQNDKLTYLDINAWYLSMSGINATEQMVEDIKTSVGI